jgi:hypothetical protein
MHQLINRRRSQSGNRRRNVDQKNPPSIWFFVCLEQLGHLSPLRDDSTSDGDLPRSYDSISSASLSSSNRVNSRPLVAQEVWKKPLQQLFFLDSKILFAQPP